MRSLHAIAQAWFFSRSLIQLIPLSVLIGHSISCYGSKGYDLKSYDLKGYESEKSNTHIHEIAPANKQANPSLSQDITETMRFTRLLHGNIDTDEVINAIQVAKQDPQGFMWFGGEHGLARYDGHDIKIYQHDPNNGASLTSNTIWDIVFDHDGVMWIATDSGLGRYHAESDTFTSYYSGGYKTNALTGDSVRALAVDERNNLLIGTDNGFNILDASRQNFQHYTNQVDDPYRLPDQRIRTVHADSSNIIWLGTTDSGLIKLQRSPFKLDVFTHNPENPQSIVHNGITDIIRDHQGTLWVSTFGGGISRMHENEKHFTHYQHDPEKANSLGSNTVWKLFEDSFQNLWIATDHGGMARYNRNTDDFSHLKHNAYNPNSLSSNNVRDIFEDRHGDLWVGTYPMGTNFFDRSSLVFENHAHIPGDPNSLSHSSILAIEKSRRGHLWMGTEGGLNAFDPQTKTSRRYLADPGNKGALQFNAVLSLQEQSNGNLWVGTWSGGLHKLDYQTQQFEHFSTKTLSSQGVSHHTLSNSQSIQDASARSVNSNYIWRLLIDKQEKFLWIGTETGGLNRLTLDTQEFHHFPIDENINNETPSSPALSNNHVWSLLEDHEGFLWIGTMHGLNKLDPSTGLFSYYFHDKDNPKSISSNRIIALFEDSNKNLWIGSQGGGISILDRNRQHLKHLTTINGLPSANVASIIEDLQGLIWITTDKGIASIEPNQYAITQYQESHGLIGNTFNRDNTYIDSNGRLYLGAAEGLSIYQTGQKNKTKQAPDIRFTDLKIFNESMNTLSPQSPLKKAIAETKSITLKNFQRVFSIDFSAISYRSSNRNQYTYKLEGFDNEWISSGNKHSATYTNIGAGNYIFKVRAANAEGIWNETGIQLEIKVLPPHWRTWWAYITYVLIAIFLLLAFIRHKEKRLELKKEKEVNARLIKIDKMKDSFLANTSHELRTPLNGIIGLAESLKDNCRSSLEKNRLKQLDMIISSGRRLSYLINDILDSSKLEDQKIELRKSNVDLRTLTDSVMTLLSPLINGKPIQLKNEIPYSFYCVNADTNRLQQILFNLIGNGIKYSDKGYVKVSATQNKNTTTICVKDTGLGIKQEDINAIFQSFFQLEHNDAREHGGTGLGLSITKQLIELHGGTIHVASQPEKGTSFIFTMPTGSTLCKHDNIPQVIPQTIAHHFYSTHTPSPITESITSKKNRLSSKDTFNNNLNPSLMTKSKMPAGSEENLGWPDHHKSAYTKLKPIQNTLNLKISPLPYANEITILIVDDDAINRMVLHGILDLHQYNLIEAKNGHEAIELMRESPKIDLVVMDVMMPKMTGYEACEIIRTAHPLYALPIIFLTAKDIEGELAQGFLSGGNDFVNKPVKKEELLARVKTQITVLQHAREIESQLEQSKLSINHITGNHTASSYTAR